MPANIREYTAFLRSWWQTRPPAERKRIAMFVLLLAAVAPMVIWMGITSAADSAREDTERIISRYERALPLAKQIQAEHAQPERVSTERSALAAAQEVIRDIDLEDRLASVSPSRSLSERDEVEMYLQGLNLPEILHLFESLNNRAGLELMRCNLNRNQNDPERMDLSLSLAR